MDTGFDLDQLATDLVSHGVEANEHALSRLAREGRDAGVSPVAVAVLGDRTEPAPARLRAFALVAGQLTSGPPKATRTPSAA